MNALLNDSSRHDGTNPASLTPEQRRSGQRSGQWLKVVLGGLLLAGALAIGQNASAWDRGPRVGVGLWINSGYGWGGEVVSPGWYDPPPRYWRRGRPHWRHRHYYRDRPYYYRDRPYWRDRGGYYRDRPRYRY